MGLCRLSRHRGRSVQDCHGPGLCAGHTAGDFPAALALTRAEVDVLSAYGQTYPAFSAFQLGAGLVRTPGGEGAAPLLPPMADSLAKRLGEKTWREHDVRELRERVT